MRTLEGVGNEIVEKQKELKEAIKNREIVELESHNLSRQILVLRTEKKDIDIKVDKSRSNIAQLSLDIKMLTSEFWNLKV